MTVTAAADFFDDLGNAVHNFSSHNIAIALSNTAPASESSNPLNAGNGVIANVTQVSYTNYSDDLATDRRLASVTWSGGTLDAADFVITASGGAIADFRYIYVFNDSATGDPLIMVYDHGSTVSLADTQALDVDFNASGIVTLAQA